MILPGEYGTLASIASNSRHGVRIPLLGKQQVSSLCISWSSPGGFILHACDGFSCKSQYCTIIQQDICDLFCHFAFIFSIHSIAYDPSTPSLILQIPSTCSTIPSPSPFPILYLLNLPFTPCPPLNPQFHSGSSPILPMIMAPLNNPRSRKRLILAQHSQ